MATKTNINPTGKKPSKSKPLPAEEKRSGKFNLTKREKAWTIPRPDGSFFFGITACHEITTRLYMCSMRALDEACQLQDETVEAFIDKVMKRGKATSRQRSYDPPRHHIYYLLFKKAENAVRRKYHLRKVHDTFFYDRYNITLERFLGEPFHKILDEQSATIPPLTEELNNKLNKTFTHRWEDYYADIEESVTETNWKEKVKLIHSLPFPSSTAGSADKAYYRASKFFLQYDSLVAVTFYLKYLHADAAEAIKGPLHRFKKNYSKLFTTPKQQEAFEKIAANLLLSGDIDTALAEAPFIFNKKFTPVHLDEKTVNNVAVRHAATVELLNKILSEEESSEAVIDKAPGKRAGTLLNEEQKLLLALFHKNKFVIDTQVMNKFAQNNGLLKSQLIDSINDTCNDILDDVLIEETETGYEILEKYYNKIIAS